MKARVAGVLAIVILVSFNFPAADAAVKPGLACKKVGSTAIVGTFKYTCVKSGKKIVWNKGVRIPVAKPTPTPTPTLTPTPTPTPTPIPTPTQINVKTFTRADVALHNTESDCWTLVDGKVYDLSSWLPQHPGGGSLLLGMCGGDGAVVLRSHHNSDQDYALTQYYIGDLR